MNYYERYCGDYQRDTAHLSLAEHGAYTMLLDTYFSVEKPLPAEFPSLYRVCRAMTRIEQQAVRTVAEQFFPVSALDGLRHNRRADREIVKARPKIEAARINGRKGGRPPKEEAGKEIGQGGQQKPGGLAGEIKNTVTETTHEATRREPGGKARHHQHQPQRHDTTEGNHTRTNAPEEQAHLPTHLPTYVPTPMPDPRLDPVPEAALYESGNGASIPPGAAGACCKTMIRQGVQGCNPHHPTLQALLQAGAMEEEFVQAARSAVSRGKASFAYVIGTVKRQREEAAKLVLHQGRMPNRQELLEASNKAATEGWLPPELRETGSTEPESGEIHNADR